MATYVLNSGAVVEFQVVGTLHQQRTRNTFHYRYAGAPAIVDGVAELTALLDDFDTQVVAGIRANLSEEWTNDYISVQAINPTRYRAIFKDIGVAGAVQGESLPSGVSAVIRRQGIASGRKYQGRVYLPGIPVARETDSALTPAAVTALTAVAQTFMTPLDGPESAQNWHMVVPFTGLIIGLDEVAAVLVDRTLRYQRRRELGVGE